MLVLDAHKNRTDILKTGAWVRKNYDPKKIILPVAGYSYFVPIMKQVINYYAKKYKITFYPVYRYSDLKPETLEKKYLCAHYPKSFTWEKRQAKNNKYVKDSLEAVNKKDEVVVVSPYGGYSYFGTKVKGGVEKLIEKSSETLLTLTKRKTYFKKADLKGKSEKKLNQILIKTYNKLSKT